MDEKFIRTEIENATDLKWAQILNPNNHWERLSRRTSIWAYNYYLGASKPELMQKFGIRARQSVCRILGSKSLMEDEYNLRLFIRRRLESRAAA